MYLKSIFVIVNSVFKELILTVQLSNRLFLPFLIVVIINRDLRAVTGVFAMHILLKMIEKEIIRHMRWTLLGAWYCFEILMDVDEKTITNRIQSGAL